jgi:hypothetical protein
MNVKEIAIIAVVIAAIAAGTVYFVFFYDSGGSVQVDQIRDDLDIGDYYTCYVYDQSTKDPEKYGMSQEEFLNILYFRENIPTYKSAQETVTYKGKSVECDVLRAPSNDLYVVDPNSHAVYEYRYASGYTWTLTDTTLGLDHKTDPLSIKVKDRVEYQIVGNFTETSRSYEVTEVKATGLTISDTALTTFGSEVIDRIVFMDKSHIWTSNEEMTYPEFKIYDIRYAIEDISKGAYKSLSKTEYVMETFFGKRAVTEENFEITDGDSFYKGTIIYGKNGAVYRCEYVEVGSDGYYHNHIYTVMKCSMFYTS